MRENIEKLKLIATSSVSDALDYFNIDGAIQGIKPLSPHMRLIGFAFTVEYELENAQHFSATASYPEQLSEYDVVVIDNAGRDFCTVWGEMLTLAAINAKANGVVIHGCCRDANEIIALNFPVFSRSTHMQTSKKRVRLKAIQKPIKIESKVVNPGDVVCADMDGVITIPKNHINEVTELAFAIDQNDKNIVSAMKNGLSLSDAKKQFQYDVFAQNFMNKQAGERR